jgi:hypothetical protein
MEQNYNKTELDELLHSVENRQDAEAPPFLYEKIRRRMSERREALLQPSTAWKIAAALALLLALNLFTFWRSSKSSAPSSSAATVASEYFQSTLNY